MMTDVMTCVEAHRRALWYNIPLEIRRAINDAIEAGKFWVDIEKPTSSIDKAKIDKCKPILSNLGYLVKWADNKSTFMSSYRISWE